MMRTMLAGLVLLAASVAHAVTCGDGVVDGGEECDAGPSPAGDLCTAACVRPGLGVTHTAAAWTSPRTGDRQIMAEVWYPATAGPAGTWDDEFGGFRNASMSPGRWPLVVFSHGFQLTEGPGIIQAYAKTARRLATQGFIVASLDHPFDTFENLGNAAYDRPIDVMRMLDVLLDEQQMPVRLRAHVDSDRVGVAGHSLGGYTAFAVGANGPFSERDPRVKAIAGLAPGIILSNDELATVRVPTLIISGALDAVTAPGALHERPYAALGPPKYFVQYVDGDHFVYTDACESYYCGARQTDRYLAAFFRTHLSTPLVDDPLLVPGAEAEFDDIVFRADPGPLLLSGTPRRSTCGFELGVARAEGFAALDGRRLECLDGAPCDGDPAVGRCAIGLQACVNVVDRAVPACVPIDVASVAVSGTKRHPDLARLATTATELLPTSDRRCGDVTQVTVAIPRGRRTGRRLIRTKALTSLGVRDTDRFVLTCITE